MRQVDTAEARSVRTTTLKSSRTRSVLLDRWEEGGQERRLVRKEFRDPSALFFLRDFLRARSEYRVLRALRERGVAVPDPHRLERVGRTWRIAMEWVPDTDTLGDYLTGNAGREYPPALVARNIGALLASLQGAGIDHGDLHAGNVLLDEQARTWMVDFHRSRLRPPLGENAVFEQLVAVAARGREESSFHFRGRVFAAWRQALPPTLGDRLPPAAELLRAIEDGARTHRRAWVQDDRRRRDSRDKPSVHPALHRRSVLCPHPIEDTRMQRLVDAADAIAHSATPLPSRWLRTELEVEGEPDRIVLLACPSTRALRERWRSVGTLAQQRLTLARPLLWVAGEPSWALFTLPKGSRPLDAGASMTEPRLGRALGSFLGSLHDRGWQPAELIDLHLAADANVWAGPELACREFDPRPGRASKAERFGALQVSAAFLDGYLAAFRHSRAETRALAAELGQSDRVEAPDERRERERR